MSFSRKVFLGIFLSTLVVGSCLIWAAYYWMSVNARESYATRYQITSRVLGRTLGQLEQNSEAIMLNAAKVVALEDEKSGLLSEKYLREIRASLNVTHIFVTDRHGRFIRSTNEDPGAIPNLYSFCPKYENLIKGTESMRGTPIIPPAPEPSPYKFLTIPNHDRSRLIEVGMRVDFIGKVLTEAVKDDPNLLAINLYAPNGTSLGHFERGTAPFIPGQIQLPQATEAVRRDGSEMKVYSRVNSTQTTCCECDVSKISNGGLYYYVIEAQVSDKELRATLASVTHLFFWLQMVALVIAALAAKLISSRLSGRVQRVVSRVVALRTDGNDDGRIGITGNDEIAYIATEFDRLLDRWSDSRSQVMEAQKTAALADLASQVSHNIRSPLASLETVVPRLSGVSDADRSILRSAISEIRDYANKLKRQTKAAPALSDPVQENEDLSLQLVGALVEGVVAEKRATQAGQSGLDLSCSLSDGVYGLFVSTQFTEFRSMLSNLINNAVESLPPSGGGVVVEVTGTAECVEISVSDNGCGIPSHLLPEVGIKGRSSKAGGSGIGVYYAKQCVSRWNGELSIESQAGFGTKVTVSIPRAKTPDWFLPSLSLDGIKEVVVLDDAVSIHDLWKLRLNFALPAVGLVHLNKGTDLLAYVEARGARPHCDQTLYLVDFDLGEVKNGLDWIESYGLAHSSILVTGMSDDPAVIQRASWLGVKVLPKELAAAVPIDGPSLQVGLTRQSEEPKSHAKSMEHGQPE